MKAPLVIICLIATSLAAGGDEEGGSRHLSRDGCPGAPALLSLRIDSPPDHCLHAGDLLQVTLSMSCLDVPLTGYQAFLEYDPNVLSFVQGDYILPEPFGLPLIYPIAGDQGELSMAAGLNPFSGQDPAQDDADLVTLVFQANTAQDITRLRFRVDVPATRATTLDGPVSPAVFDSPALLVRPCDSCLWSDVNCDDVADHSDVRQIGDCLQGPDHFVSEECRPADFDDDSDVDMHDIGVFQQHY